jgi:Flp pilus assembly protein TadB
MFDTSGPVGLAADPFEHAPAGAAVGLDHSFHLPGLVAAAIWAVGLLIGVVAFATGHTWIALVALCAAVLAPWFGLAWVSHAQREAYNIALPSHD